mmetsp:Transcript_19006/g.26737  ORF Transcript_19006/g.26737 Transcript_19006/m.26737 type:complete len:86 (+) Transcript_19006:507-764(+)
MRREKKRGIKRQFPCTGEAERKARYEREGGGSCEGGQKGGYRRRSVSKKQETSLQNGGEQGWSVACVIPTVSSAAAARAHQATLV